MKLRNRMPEDRRHCLLYIRSSDPSSVHRVTQKTWVVFCYLVDGGLIRRSYYFGGGGRGAPEQ